MTSFFDKYVGRFCIGMLLLLAMCVKAEAQTAWDTNILNWVAPTQCVDNTPITNCPVTGYRIEQSATATGTFTTLISVGTVLTYSHTGVSAGQHCYRLIALSNSGNSDPSNVACRTNVRPPSPPQPPVLTIAALAGLEIPLDSRDGFTRTVAYTVTANGPGVLAAFCKITTPAVSGPVFTYRNQNYCKPLANHPRTGAPNCAFVKGVSADAVIAAPCA